MESKEEKAKKHAEKMWGDYFYDEYPDKFLEGTFGQVSQNDYLAGYNQALEDVKVNEMRDMLKKCYSEFKKQAEKGMYPEGFLQENGGEGLREISRLFKDPTEI